MTRALLVAGALTLTTHCVGLAAADDGAQARFDFVLNCSGCHGTDAAGSTIVPALGGVARLAGSAEGRAYLIRVPGVAQAPLSDTRLARLMNFVVSEIAGAPAFAPYTAEEVARLRADPLRSPRSARPQ